MENSTNKIEAIVRELKYNRDWVNGQQVIPEHKFEEIAASIVRLFIAPDVVAIEEPTLTNEQKLTCQEIVNRFDPELVTSLKSKIIEDFIELTDDATHPHELVDQVVHHVFYLLAL